VLNEPEPWALVDSLGSAAVVLRIYFWLDGSKHSWLKARSSVIRLVKRQFQEAGINMPDEAREIIFPAGVPVQLSRGEDPPTQPNENDQIRTHPTVLGQDSSEPSTTKAEGGLGSEAEAIESQARHSRPIEGENLLQRDGHEQEEPIEPIE
jgi:hypothetical protein